MLVNVSRIQWLVLVMYRNRGSGRSPSIIGNGGQKRLDNIQWNANVIWTITIILIYSFYIRHLRVVVRLAVICHRFFFFGFKYPVRQSSSLPLFPGLQIENTVNPLIVLIITECAGNSLTLLAPFTAENIKNINIIHILNRFGRARWHYTRSGGKLLFFYCATRIRNLNWKIIVGYVQTKIIHFNSTHIETVRFVYSKFSITVSRCAPNTCFPNVNCSKC